MLRPADGVANGAGLLAPRGAGEDVGHFEEALLGNAAVLFDHLRRVAREVTLENMEDTSRMLQRRIAIWLVQMLRFAAAIFGVPSPLLVHSRLHRRLRTFVEPRLRVVLFLF